MVCAGSELPGSSVAPVQGAEGRASHGQEQSNKVILLGNVGKDPEIASSAARTMVATFGLATSERQKDQQGNWQDKTERHTPWPPAAPPRSSAITSRRAPNSSSRAVSRPATMKTRSTPAAKSTAPRLSSTTSRCFQRATRARRASGSAPASTSASPPAPTIWPRPRSPTTTFRSESAGSGPTVFKNSTKSFENSHGEAWKRPERGCFCRLCLPMSTVT